MKHTRFVMVGVAIALVVCLATVPTLADKKIKAYKAQTTHAFVNGETEPEPAHGLRVTLSGAGEVKTDDESGRAGPFRDVSGNGTGSVTLTNPESPIEPGDESFELVFGSYSKQISVTAWWWTDGKGKRIGKKKKG